jgi:hypothetical protein
MPINMTAVGTAGTHSFRRSNVNTVDDYIYYKNVTGSVIPATLANGNSFIYAAGVGSIEGYTEGQLVYVTTTEPKKLKFSATSGGASINATGYQAGSITFNTPIVYNNKVNIDGSTSSNQAVKYYTTGTPLTGLTSGQTYFLKNVSVSDFAGQQSLYAFTAFTFSSCNQTGRTGPTLSQIRNAYTSIASWTQTYINQGDYLGYQDWIVPVSGIYSFDVRGASAFDPAAITATITTAALTANVATITTSSAHGLNAGQAVTIAGATNAVYNGNYRIVSVPTSTTFTYSRVNANIGSAASSGTASLILSQGRGGRVTGRVTLTKGEIVTVVVGQRGENGTSTAINTYYGSGGATFVVRKNGSEPLFVAGGGSASSGLTPGRDAVMTRLGGSNSQGATSGLVVGIGGSSLGGNAGGGGGFTSRGGNGGSTSPFNTGGGAYNDGLTAAAQSGRIGGAGGFGGGGSADGNSGGQAGGGGGYSGGVAARTTTASVVGAGGGSFIIPTATNVGTSTGSYDGTTTFNSVSITNLASYNTGDGSVVATLVSSFTNGNEVYPTAADSEAGTNKIAIAPAGNSYHAFVPINYDADNDLIYSPTAHTLSEGEAIVPTFNTTAPAGVATGTIYYVDVVDNFTYRLSSTPAPSFTTINLTTPSGRSTAVPDKVSRVVVNTVTDVLTITAHGFLVDQPILYNNGSGNPAGNNTGSIGGLIHLNTYFVQEVINSNQIRLKVALDPATPPINFTSPGTGTEHSFIFITVNIAADTLYIPNHGLISGQAVRYNNGGSSSIGGLVHLNDYFVIKVDNSTIKLSSNADLSNPININNVGGGTQSLLVTALDFAADTLAIPNHGFLQKELVLYDAKGQTVINGLTTATPYYVIFVDGNKIKLATTPENADAGTAVNITDTPAGVGTHSLQSLSKTPDGIYTITSLDEEDPTTFTVTAAGRVPLITKTFNPRTAMDLNLSAFKLTSHGFVTGTKLTYDKGDSATVITGLTDLTDYFVVSINRDYFRLATSASNAASGTTLTVTDFGTGVGHKFTTSQLNGNITGGGSVTIVSGSVLVNGVGTQFSKILKVGDRFRLFPPNTVVNINFIPADINTSTNIITKTSHGFSTGDTVQFNVNGGVSPAPLVDQYYYFVRAVSSSTITLHSSASDAVANINVVAISTQGTVGGIGYFSLTETIPVGPIIRRITAIGSDTQISVDRPYASAYNAVSYSYPTFIYVRPEGYSLHRPFDGGVEMSVGARTSLGQIVRQTRKYFRYQSGKGIQTSCGINFKPSIDIESMTQFGGQVIEVKTRRPHGLISGLNIKVSEATDSFGDPSTVYNGTFAVTVVDLTTFRITAAEPVIESRAYGFPQFYVTQWENGAVRTGMFDDQNGMFFEYDGTKIYAVRRSSTQQIAGTVAALQGSELIFGTNTSFQAQLNVGDYVVMRGQSYRIVEIGSQTRMSVRPEYKGSSGTEKEFNPSSVVNTSTDVFSIISHGFSNLLPITYNSIDGEPIGGLINGRTYYVSLIDNNSFKLKASPDSVGFVNLSSFGTTTIHSFVPAKSGIIVTKTVDTKVPQEDWSIDICDGSGVTGYNLDLSRIQMAYIDYSWYGAGKIRFGFKTTDGQVQYVHEYVHNNNLFESYLRSGNLPARYEVVTYNNPTYIPSLFHWGTSVMMDGRFDDDNAYLFTGSSQTLNILGTTAKSFASTGINLSTDLFTVQSHGFTTGEILQFQSLGSNGLLGVNSLNPATQVVGSNALANLTNNAKYKAFVNSANLIHLTPLTATITVGATVERTTNTITVTTATPHGLTTGMYVGIYGLTATNLVNGPFTVTRTNDTVFTYTVSGSQTVASIAQPGAAISEVINFTTQGNTQYTYFLYPDGSANNTSGPNYQPLISIRLSPSVSSGLTGKLGDRDVINRMQLRLKEIGVSTTQLVDCKVLLNSRLNNLGFVGVDSPSLTQLVEHTAADTVSGGVQVYNFRASGGQGGVEETTVVDVSTLFELSNSILGGDSIYPDGPDILTIAVSRLTGNATLASAKLSWSEAQA